MLASMEWSVLIRRNMEMLESGENWEELSRERRSKLEMTEVVKWINKNGNGIEWSKGMSEFDRLTAKSQYSNVTFGIIRLPESRAIKN